MSLPERVRLLLRPRSPIGPKMRARTTAAVLRPILRMRYPMTPKMNMRTTSTKLLLMAKEPTTQRTKMHGMRMASEILAMCAKMRQPPSPMRSMKNCTMTKPAKKVQVIGAYFVKSSGPGWRPWMMRPPMRTAVTDSPGMPRVSVGMSEPPVTALFAASEPATPSMEPCPNFSGVLENCLAVLQPRKQAMEAPAPGRMPMMFPMSHA